MLASPPRTAAPDTRVPAVTVVPQAATAIALAADPEVARVGFLLAVGLDLPLAIVGRMERRHPPLTWARPGVAVAWAIVCLLIAGELPGHLVAAASAAAWCSLAIGVVLWVVPGTWSPEGVRFAHVRSLGIPVTRAVIAHVARRAGPVVLVLVFLQ